MKIAIRVDASLQIGSGHLMRCKTLAEELQRRGAQVSFICRELPGDLIDLLQNEGYSVYRLPLPQTELTTDSKHGKYANWLGVTQEQDATDTQEALLALQPDWLVVDHYGLDRQWEEAVRAQALKLLVIDDLANRAHRCDMLLDQNWFGNSTTTRYQSWVENSCQCLLGSRYALLSPVYHQLHKTMPQRDGLVKRILLFFGGVDSHNQTAQAIRALSSATFSEPAVDVVIGKTNPHFQEIEQLVAARPHTTLYRQIPSLAALMLRADLMLAAGGATTWERCCLGLPAITVIASENQQYFSELLAEIGVHILVGNAPHRAVQINERDWAQTMQAMLSDANKLISMSTQAKTLTDGYGAQRVAAALGLIGRSLYLRNAKLVDEALLLEWANDPDVRQNAFNPKSITATEHHHWLLDKLKTPNSFLFIAQDEYGLPLGQVRFDCENNQALVDISVDAALRGKQLGRRLLKKAIDRLRELGRRETIVAEILQKNKASQNLFEQLAFHPVHTNEQRIRYVLD